MRVIIVLFLVTHVRGYCWGPGYNPGFSAPPRIEQVNLKTVRVSWGHNIVVDRSCADQFLVKYWMTSDPGNYKTTELAPRHVNFMDVDVVPKVAYTFEAVAREDKGPIGIDWNKSPQVEFKTSSYFSPALPPPPPEDEDDNEGNGDLTYSSPSSPVNNGPSANQHGSKNVRVAGMSVEYFVGLIILSLILLLIVIGGSYKVYRNCKGKDSRKIHTTTSDQEAAQQSEHLNPNTDTTTSQ